MAIQAHINPNNNLQLPSQDHFFMSNNNNNNNLLYAKLLQQQQQQQQFQYAQQLQQQQQQQQQQQFYVNDGSFMFSQPSKRQKFHETTTTSSMTSDCDNHMSSLLEKQRNEIDRFVNLQNERLRLALQEQRKQQFGEIIKKLEEKTLQLLKQKDDEIKAISKKTMELQEMLKKIEIENQTWQRIALENQSMVFSLNNTLEQLKQQQQQQQQACSSSSSNNVDDNASYCNIGAKTGENRVLFIDKDLERQQHYPSTSKAPANYGVIDKNLETRRNEGSLCKICKSRNSTILLLPCRHLCCCKVCDSFVDDCPVCKSSKTASIEALIS